MKTTIIISNESQEVTREAIYMLLNARKLLFILTPLLTLLITIGTIYLIHHLNLHHQNQHQRQNQHLQQQQQQQQRRVGSRQSSTIGSNSLQRQNQQQQQQQPVSKNYLQNNNNSRSSIISANHHRSSSFSEKLVNIGEKISSIEEQLSNRQRHSRHEPKAMEPNRNGQTSLVENKTNSNDMSMSKNIVAENIALINNNSGSSIKVDNQSIKEEKSSQTVNIISELGQQQVSNIESSEQQTSNDDELRRTSFDISLDRGNFVLSSRCSNDKIYIKINKRTKMPIISTSPQNLFKSSNNSRQKDAAKIKLLSTIFTIESVTTTTTTTQHTNDMSNLDANNNDGMLNNHEIATKKRRTDLQVPAESAIKTVIQTDYSERGGEEERISLLKEVEGDHQVKRLSPSVPVPVSGKELEAGVQRAEPLLPAQDIGFSLNRSPLVRLRANLTQLYICFSLQGKLEGRVSISCKK